MVPGPLQKISLIASRGTQSQTVRAWRGIISCSVKVHRRYPIYKTHHWFLCSRKMLMIIGTSIEIENYQLHGQVPQDSLCWMKKPIGWIYTVGGDIDEKTNNLKTRQCMTRYGEAYVWCIEAKSQEKVAYEETWTRQCQTRTGYLLRWTKWGRI